MIAAIKIIYDDLSERIDNLGLVSACGLAIRGEVYAGQSGEEQIKQSLKSLVKPYGMPLVGVGFIYFGSRWIIGKIAAKVEGWRWYFKWPVKVIAGLGGFILFLGGLELLSNSDYDDTTKYRKEQREHYNKLIRLAKRDLAKGGITSNTVESDGAGGLRRRIDDYKFRRLTPRAAIFTTDRDKGRDSRVTLQGGSDRLGYVKYHRNKPHWRKNLTHQWRSNPFKKEIDLTKFLDKV